MDTNAGSSEKHETPYKMVYSDGLLTVGFSKPTTNQILVEYVSNEIHKMNIPSGTMLKINGPSSVAVAYTIALSIGSRFKEIAIFDPNMKGYIVVKGSEVHELGSIIS